MLSQMHATVGQGAENIPTNKLSYGPIIRLWLRVFKICVRALASPFEDDGDRSRLGDASRHDLAARVLQVPLSEGDGREAAGDVDHRATAQPRAPSPPYRRAGGC